jgi:RNA polymerase sigma-70 factor (ECF subfamily)
VPLDDALRARVYAFALRLTGDRERADETAQETLVRVLEGDLPRDLPYLFRIALNLVRSEGRTRARRRVAGSPSLDRVADSRTPDPLESLARREARERFWRCLGRLPAREREALVMRHAEGLACAEIAAVLGVSANAVSCLLRRGRDRLAAALAPGSEER